MGRCGKYLKGIDNLNSFKLSRVSSQRPFNQPLEQLYDEVRPISRGSRICEEGWENSETAGLARKGGGDGEWLNWGHCGVTVILSRANGRETRLDPYLSHFLDFFSFAYFFFPAFFPAMILLFDFLFTCSLQSPLHATHEKSKISTVHSERRISCYRIITTFGFF